MVSKTQQTIDGITFDLNRIKRGTFEELARAGDNIALTHRIIDEVVIAWDYDQPANSEGFMQLGLLDARQIEQVIMNALDDLTQKKSENGST